MHQLFRYFFLCNKFNDKNFAIPKGGITSCRTAAYTFGWRFVHGDFSENPKHNRSVFSLSNATSCASAKH